MIQRALKSAATWMVGAEVTLGPGESIVLDGTARVYVRDSWSRIGRLVLTSERLVFQPILMGVVERLRRDSRWQREWRLADVVRVEALPSTAGPRLKGAMLLEMHLRNGEIARLKTREAQAIQQLVRQ